MQATISPYGSWASPIQIEDMLSSGVRLGETRFDGDCLYWLEGRPTEQGRQVVVRRTPDGTLTDMTPEGYNARTRVHEYGGGSYAVFDDVVYFVNFSDQQIYRIAGCQTEATLVTRGSVRYSSLAIDSANNRLIAVAEKHTSSGVDNYIAEIRLGQSGPVRPRKLVGGYDFYSSPRLSPDGKHLAWVCWNHPNMPWDSTYLMVARIGTTGRIGKAYTVAGDGHESVMQPAWSPDGETLYFIGDRTNWWNIHAVNGFDNFTGNVPEAVNLMPRDCEFGGPGWILDSRSYAVTTDNRLIVTYSDGGLGALGVISGNRDSGYSLERVELPYTDIGSVVVNGDRAAMLAGSSSKSPAVVELDLTSQSLIVHKQGSALEFDEGYIAKPQSIEFPTDDGEIAYGLFYPPTNKDFQAPAGELPPLLVKIHGGPTAAAGSGLNLGIQYWTTRGWAVVDVNYRGSTGFGREYRDALKGRWGIVDRIDCESAAGYLARQGLVDGERLAITGGSAGGYTTLCALTFGSTFKAGASHFGVSDLAALAGDTHKFESRYLDGLVGPYPSAKALYDERSPLMHAEQLDCPVMFLQGDEDKIVPPNQAESMVSVLRERKTPVAYLLFQGEQHGFRQAPNIRRAIEGEFFFYSKIFGYTPADDIDPVEIENF